MQITMNMTRTVWQDISILRKAWLLQSARLPIKVTMLQNSFQSPVHGRQHSCPLISLHVRPHGISLSRPSSSFFLHPMPVDISTFLDIVPQSDKYP